MLADQCERPLLQPKRGAFLYADLGPLGGPPERREHRHVGREADPEQAPLGVLVTAANRCGHEVASLPATEMVAPVRAALLPGYAKLASDGERLRAGFATTFGRAVGMTAASTVAA